MTGSETGSVIERLNAALEGRYRIERELGEGGMATVFLAEDLKHGRKVALKVLKPELAAVVGGERFLAEIRTTAQLQHPHILPLHDSGEADSFLFYVMPYVEGESLRDRLDREKQLPVDETVRLATDVAEALGHAHRHGVIHRDVKPANILLQDGRPVVADFGIALAVSAAGGGRLTETGLSLGTPYYMSPEQATGDREVDARSDVFALGCVVYEALTGEPPFGGATAQAVLGRILMGNVEAPTVHRKGIPANVEGAILRALEKLPADRFASAMELAEALKNPSFRHPAEERRAVAAGRARRGPAWIPVALVGVLVAALAGAAGWMGGKGSTAMPRIERQRVLLGSGPERIGELVAFRAGLHPHGDGIIFADTTHVDGNVVLSTWWKGREEVEPTRLSSMAGAISPTFSPDGEWVAFVQGGSLLKQPLTGGNSVTLAPGVAGGTAHALAWLDDGTILFENSGFIIQRIPDSGRGEPVTVSTEERTAQPIHMTGLPGSWGALVSACVGSCPAGTRLSLLDLEADTVVILAENVVRAWPAPQDHVIYLTRGGGVFAARLDRASRSLGPPTPLFDGVRVSPDANGEMHVATDGTALFVRGTATVGFYSLDRVDRTGRAGWIGGVRSLENFVSVAFSPDGRHLAATIRGSSGEQLWVKELPNGPFVPLTPNQASASRPVWFPDGSRIAYVSFEGAGHVRSIRADGGSGRPDTLYEGDVPVYEVELTATGDTLLMRTNSTAGNAADVVMLVRGSSEGPVPLLASAFAEYSIDLSPDGRWLAYTSNVSGRQEVYVRPFPEASGRQVPVSLSGGIEPVWSPTGEELFYRDAEGWLVAARISADPEFRVESREPLFDASGYQTVGGWHGYDVHPDGQGFVMLAPGPGGVADVGDLVLIENLFTALRQARDQ